MNSFEKYSESVWIGSGDNNTSYAIMHVTHYMYMSAIYTPLIMACKCRRRCKDVKTSSNIQLIYHMLNIAKYL